MTHTSCLICASASISPLSDFTKDELYKCQACGFVFAHKIPTEDELIAEYLKYPRRDYMSPVNLMRFEEYLDIFEKYKKTNNILEIGAGVGFFAKMAKDRGWNVFATEFDDVAVQKCRDKGITVHQGKLNASNYSPEFFDAVFTTEVIEHINNPEEEVNIIHSVLRKGGVIILTTPNFNAITRRIIGEKWNVIAYPEHLSYYTPKTLSYIFEKNGFKKKWIMTNAISINQFFKSNNQVADSDYDESLRMKATNKLIYKIPKTILNFILNITGTGESIKAMFEKK